LAGGAPLRDGKVSATATIVAIANERGVRALRGGGSVFAHHGLISPRVAPHVSMIVDPPGVRPLAQGLVERGWWLVPAATRGVLPRAIVALATPERDTYVHLHGVIPGFVVDPADVFDDLWDARDQLSLPGTFVPILDRYSTIVFAMHDRLAGQTRPRSLPGNREYFGRHFDSSLTDADRVAIVALTSRLGAQHELRGMLDRLGVVRQGGRPMVSSAYVRARLALDDVRDGDVDLLSRLERGDWNGVPRASFGSLAAAAARMVNARARVNARDRPRPEAVTRNRRSR
jgi:hypothetical protein